jgi:hypothetical protein
MSIIECVFCKELKPKSKEHIIPIWLQKKIIGNVNWNYEGTHRSSLLIELSKRKHTGDSLVFGKVYNNCNNGWMSKLETDFIPLFSNLNYDNSSILRLSKIERFIISLWCFKTAIVINAGSNYRKIVPNEQFEFIYKYKNLPKNVKVDVSFVDNNHKIFWQQTQIMFHLRENSNQLNRNYVITTQLDSLAFRVSWLESAKENDRDIKFNENGKTLRIWPYKKNSKLNPKSKFDNLESFANDIFSDKK